MRAPFLALSLGLAAGIWTARLTGGPVYLWATGLFLSLCAGWFFFLWKKHKAALAFILLTGFFIGTLRYSLFHASYTSNALHSLRLTGYADFEGRLYRSVARGRDGHHLFLRVDKVVYQKKESRVKGRLRITVAGAESDSLKNLRPLRTGDRVRVSARLREGRNFLNFDPPFYERTLEMQNVHRTAFTKSALLVEKMAAGPALPPQRMASSLRTHLLDKIEAVFTDPSTGRLPTSAAVLEALLLGERGRLDPETIQSLQASGLFHLFAISGAHVAVFTFLVFSLLRLVRIPPQLASLLLIILLVFYAFLVEGRASVLRAVIMAVLYLLGKILWRDVHLLNTISLSAFALLLWNPVSLWDAGFQLTFAATLSLILFTPRILRRLPRLPLRIAELFAVSLAAQLAVTPFLASTFHRVALSGIFLNLAAVPLMSILMAGGYIFLILALLHSGTAQLLGQVLEVLVQIFLAISRVGESLPLLSYRIPAPPPAVVILYFLLLLALLLPRRFKHQRAVFLVSFLAVFCVLVIHPFPAQASRGLRMTFLDVGQGDSILVEFPGRKKMLVDGGGLPAGDFDIGESVVSPFLWRKGMKKVDVLVSTHAHPDHIGGLAAVARNFRPGEVWEATIPEQDVWFQRFRSSLPAATRLRRVAAGFVHEVSGTRVEVLHPRPSVTDSRRVDNETSLVLRLEYGTASFLLTADIGRTSEEQLLRQAGPIESRVLKAGHHGSDSSTSQEFLLRVKPKLVVISVGKGNVYGFPRPDVLERCRRVGALIFRTDIDGAVEITTDGRLLRVRTGAGRRAVIKLSDLT